jgi:hypothetical protein
MLEHGGSKILPVIPQLIIPIKSKLKNILTLDMFFCTVLIGCQEISGEKV